MVKHIVIWKLKEEAEGADKHENAAKLKYLLETLRERIPSVCKLEVGIDFSGTAASGDIVFYAEFADHAAFEAFKIHPEYQTVTDVLRSVITEGRFVDYEV
jgi:hypothetical protein